MIKALCLLVFLPIFAVSSFRLNGIEWQEVSNDLHERQLDLTDFESGSTGPWLDESAADARWLLEDLSSPLDPAQPAPQPLTGTKYLRVNRPAGTTGQAVLRSQPFTVSPGDQFRLSFWIRSQIIQTNNLEVYWTNNGVQERILSLVEFSTPTNFEWRSYTVLIPATQVVQTRLAIFGFCNAGNVDAIAIDNLVVESSDQTPSPTSTTTGGGTGTTSTTTSTTTSSPGTCPSNLGPNQVTCQTLSGKCYCFSLYQVDNWSVGDSYCRSNGATLLSLETQTEISLINDYVSSSGLDKNAYWTSGQWGSNGYVWTGSNQPVTASNWYPGQPNDNASGYCIRLFYGADYAGRWSDIICTGEGYTPFYFICEL